MYYNVQVPGKLISLSSHKSSHGPGDEYYV